MNFDLTEEAKKQLDYMIARHRYLHRHPCVSFHEEDARDYLATEIAALGPDTLRPCGKNGLVADLHGHTGGKTIAFRADMDALPIQEETGLPFASENPGVMHACGHDCHTAALLGLLRSMTQHRAALKYNVRFIFQYAEEPDPGGAIDMIANGCLAGVDRIYGLHVDNQLSVGTIGIKDGPYMAQPFYMEYETRFNKMQGCIDSYKQFMNIKKHMRDEKTGLYYHGYDESRQMYWADPETGCSPNFWLRAMGWFLVAMVDVLERMDEQLYNEYRGIMAMLKQAVEDMHKFQDEQTGMFWQVIDHPEAEGNYLETSGTALFAYAVLKGVRLGYLPKQKELEQESRHLGLDFSRSKETEGLDMLAGLLEEHVDWELLLSTTGLPLPAAAVKEKPVLSEPGKLHVSVARNEESFSFLYAEHLDILHRMGTVTFFNPEQDRAIPQETDLLYLPGGYPENRLEELAGARLARESIRSYIEAGGRTLAECGGMIYLSQSVLSDGDTDGGSAGSCVGNIGNEMVGVLPFSITNERKRRKLTLGYRRFDYNGWRLKGHEFHYTQFAVPETDGKEGGACSLPLSIAQVYNAKGGKVTTPVFRYKNLIASYTHLYWGEVDVMALFGEL